MNNRKLITSQKLTKRNQAITTAYYAILKAAKALLATLEEERLRYTLTRVDKHKDTKAIILHEFLSPLIYLRLELHQNDEFSIHYGYELSPVFGPYYHITAAFIRLVYKLTMASNTTINIEEAVRTDWIVDNCSEAYEYLEQRNKHHQFKLIKYRVRPVRRKLRRVA
ncbi:hypothetical protein MUY27_13925 [Mucilaginibacter sp. RS28]|uniref:Uncharacterized protein n=1 Tax=Mucilaginibacter straminoryzae TaxID=2932774 RepID=A0A9X2B9V5_9SPHI|nr:hypothetical protein [Mucilaginibacter straminoryzae]MCJ8210811.1 hypothetical protein [Mucilaginibacter straminoryzae]